MVSTRYKSVNRRDPILVQSSSPERALNQSNQCLNTKSTELKLPTEETEEPTKVKQVTASYNDRPMKTTRSIFLSSQTEGNMTQKRAVRIYETSSLKPQLVSPRALARLNVKSVTSSEAPATIQSVMTSSETVRLNNSSPPRVSWRHNSIKLKPMVRLPKALPKRHESSPIVTD